MEKSGFFNANLVGENYDREYLAQDFAQYFASFIGNGVFPNPSTGLQVVYSSGMQINVLAGEAWINGYWYQNSTQKTFTLLPASGTLNRIDSVVVRHSLSGRIISIEVKAGVPAVSPIAPAPNRDADAFELVLAQVSVRKGAISINQVDIQDTRLNKTLCGIVHGVVDQLDTSTLGKQLQEFIDDYILNAKSDYDKYLDNLNNLYNLANQEYESFKAFVESLQNMSQKDYEDFIDWLNTFKQESEQEFNSWFQTIKDILDEEVASHLLSMIQELQKSNPTEFLCEIQNPFNGYIYCKTFASVDGAGMQGYGIGGYGGSELNEIQNKVIENEFVSTKIFIPNEYIGLGQLEKVSENQLVYTLTGTNKSISIFIRRV